MKNTLELINKIKYENIYNWFSKFTFQGKNLDISDKNIYYTYYNRNIDTFIYIGKINNYYFFNNYNYINKYVIFSNKFIVAKDIKFNESNIEIPYKKVQTLGYDNNYINLHILYQYNTANEILNNFEIIL